MAASFSVSQVGIAEFLVGVSSSQVTALEPCRSWCCLWCVPPGVVFHHVSKLESNAKHMLLLQSFHVCFSFDVVQVLNETSGIEGGCIAIGVSFPAGESITITKHFISEGNLKPGFCDWTPVSICRWTIMETLWNFVCSSIIVTTSQWPGHSRTQ